MEIHADSELNVVEPDYLRQLPRIMSKYSPRTIDNYILWRIVQEYVHLLPLEFQEPSEKFSEMLLGVTARPMRWEQCVETVTHHLPMIVGSMYVRRYFESEDKNEITKIMEALRNSFIQRLEKVTWMDETTRTKALGKAYKMRPKFGYPDRLYDEAWLARRWAGVSFRIFPSKSVKLLFYWAFLIHEIYGISSLFGHSCQTLPFPW